MDELKKNKNNPEAGKKIMKDNANTSDTTTAVLTNEQVQQQQVMEKAQTHMDKWLEDKSEGISAARKYYPALSQLRLQSKLLRILEDPKKTFIFALITTIGFLDMTLILIGLISAYITAAIDF
jgi:glucuronate isomerase